MVGDPVSVELVWLKPKLGAADRKERRDDSACSGLPSTGRREGHRAGAARRLTFYANLKVVRLVVGVTHARASARSAATL